MATTKIPWAEKVWNPITGRTPISDGCRNCYARRMAQRLKGRLGYPADDPFKVTVHWDKMGEPLHWRKPSMIFVCSMGDLFHADVPWNAVYKVYEMMLNCKHHTFIILTKRPQIASWYLNNIEIHLRRNYPDVIWPLPNVWGGVSIEDQATADERMPKIFKCAFSKYVVSYEPALGPVDFKRIKYNHGWIDAMYGDYKENDEEVLCAAPGSIDWLIMGGESGPGARPMHPDWARSARDQCEEAGVPFFFKQWGAWEIASEENGHYDHDMMSNKAVWLSIDGETSKPSCKFLDKNPYAMTRVGKKKAGHLLDGREHREVPDHG